VYFGEQDKPSDRWALIYLNVDGRHEQAEGAVVPNNGKELKPKHQIGPYGYRTVIAESASRSGWFETGLDRDVCPCPLRIGPCGIGAANHAQYVRSSHFDLDICF
jgi:hypothetical protein